MLHKIAAIFLTCIVCCMYTPVYAINLDNTNCTIHTQRYQTYIYTTVRPENANDGQYVVVVDAGHGGHDPGCVGKHSKEKHIALAIAKKLKNDIQKIRSDIKVIMTRDKDVFVPLHKRISIANKNKADLFISIHCNFAGNPHACGSETFVMGLHRADDNLDVAKRENSVVLMENDFEKNYDGYDPNSPIGHILLSNYQNAFLNSSISLASEIEKSIGSRSFSKSRGVKQAGFVVLREATMPSVLVESGFLSNAREEAYLLSKEGQSVIAQGISSAVDRFLPYVHSQKKKPKKMAKVTKKKNKKAALPPIKKKKSTSPDLVTSDAIYSVQIGVFSSPKRSKLSQKVDLGNIIEIKKNGLYKYMIGKFTNKKDAHSACVELKAKGYKDAYVVEL